MIIVNLWAVRVGGVTCTFAAVFLWLWPFTTHAEPTDSRPNSGMARPGEPCRVGLIDIPASWTEADQWAWTNICEGREADFNARLGVKFNPGNPEHKEHWSDERRFLGRDFLKTILLHDPFRSAIPHLGIRIYGAVFKHEIDLQDGHIGRPIALQTSAFESWVRLDRVTTPLFVSFDGSNFASELIMDSVSIGTHLFMRDAAFQEVYLGGAAIGGQFSMVRSRFSGILEMDSISVGKSIIMRESADFQSVIIGGADIGAHVFMNGSTFRDLLNMNLVSIGGNLYMNGDGFFDEVNLRAATIAGTLDARGSAFRSLDLTGTRIDGSMVLGTQNDTVTWTARREQGNIAHTAQLILQNTIIGALQDTENSWPTALELEGFTYNRLGATGANVEDMPHQRGSDWYISWLALDRSYSPQPYRQLASVLDTSGHRAMASNILFANRERERAESDPSEGNWWLLSSLKFTIGYGYGLHYFRVIYWIIFLTLIGTCLLRLEKKCHDNGEKLGFWYSLDMLLPIIQLRKQHYEIDLSNRVVRYYFYSHKLIGYLLVFFVIAGLTGLTE